VPRIIDFTTDDNTTISIEAVDVADDRPIPAGRSSAEDERDRKFLHLVGRISEIATAVSGQMDALKEKITAPAETKVEFGISVTTESTVILSKLGAEGTLSVTLTWKNPDGPEPRRE
jgi:hypothetical protein